MLKYKPEYENVLRVMDFYDDGKTDNEIIDDCLRFTFGFQVRTIVFDKKDWFIDRAILLPSDTTVIVDGVMIKQKNLTFDNIFRGNNLEIDPENPYGFPLKVHPISNIRILGKNGAKLIGPDLLRRMKHPNMGDEQEMVGDYWGWRNLQVSLSRCTNFELAGFDFEKQRSWAVSFDRCSFGYIHDLNFNATVKNGDGVNIRLGCHDIIVDHITGFTSDDCVAINSSGVITDYPYNQYVFPNIPSNYLLKEGEDIRERDIYNVTVSNVLSYSYLCHRVVALLARSGHRIYNIHINNIVDGNPVTSKLDRIAMVGSHVGYGGGYIPFDMHSMRINHIVSNTARKAVEFTDPVKDIWINDVVQNREDGCVLNAVNPEAVTMTNCRKGNSR